jgi:hypothetical protein
VYRVRIEIAAKLGGGQQKNKFAGAAKEARQESCLVYSF